MDLVNLVKWSTSSFNQEYGLCKDVFGVGVGVSTPFLFWSYASISKYYGQNDIIVMATLLTKSFQGLKQAQRIDFLKNDLRSIQIPQKPEIFGTSPFEGLKFV